MANIDFHFIKEKARKEHFLSDFLSIKYYFLIKVPFISQQMHIVWEQLLIGVHM